MLQAFQRVRYVDATLEGQTMHPLPDSQFMNINVLCEIDTFLQGFAKVLGKSYNMQPSGEKQNSIMMGTFYMPSMGVEPS